MSKGSTQQTTSIDPGSQDYINAMRQSATNAAQGQVPGASPLLDQAASGFSGAQAAGAAGNKAIATGDYSQFMNPYQQQVINQMNGNWSNLNQQATGSADSAATAAGAFGGSRSGVAEGTATAGLANSQAGQIASLLNSGYANAQGAAQGAAGLGLQASQGMEGAGQFGTNLGFQQAAFPTSILAAGYGGQEGSTQTQTQTPNYWNDAIGLGGLAMMA